TRGQAFGIKPAMIRCEGVRYMVVVIERMGRWKSYVSLQKFGTSAPIQTYSEGSTCDLGGWGMSLLRRLPIDQQPDDAEDDVRDPHGEGGVERGVRRSHGGHLHGKDVQQREQYAEYHVYPGTSAHFPAGDAHSDQRKDIGGERVGSTLLLLHLVVVHFASPARFFRFDVCSYHVSVQGGHIVQALPQVLEL